MTELSIWGALLPLLIHHSKMLWCSCTNSWTALSGGNCQEAPGSNENIPEMFGVRMKSFCCSAGFYSLGLITKFLFFFLFYFLFCKVYGTGEKQRPIACSRQGPCVLTPDPNIGVVRKFSSQKNVSLSWRPVGTVSRGYSLSWGKINHHRSLMPAGWDWFLNFELDIFRITGKRKFVMSCTFAWKTRLEVLPPMDKGAEWAQSVRYFTIPRDSHLSFVIKLVLVHSCFCPSCFSPALKQFPLSPLS